MSSESSKTQQFFGNDKEDPHAHIRYFNKITSTMKISNVPNTSVKLMLFPFSLEGAARIWLEKEPPRSIETWDDLAWDRFNDLLRGCPHHGFSELHQLDTFYNALNSIDQDSLNSAAGGNFLDKMPRECLKIIESKSKISIRGNNFNQNRGNNFNQGQIYRPPVNQPVAHQGPAPQTHGVSKTDFERYVTANDAVLRNMQNQGQNLQSQMANLTDMLSKFVTANTASTSGSGTLPGNTVTNPKEDLKVPKASIPFPSRRNDERRKEKANDQIEKFYEIFRDLSFEISFTDALMLMPKFASTLKTLIGNKEKLSEKKLARTPLNENCSAVILNKLPKKLGDPGRFLIPCEFTGITTCNALADLGASINLMPYSVWNNLSLPELTPTCMTLELADRSITKPIGENTLRVARRPSQFQSGPNFKIHDLITTIDVNKIDVIDMACDEYSQEVLGFSNVIASGNPTPYFEPIVSTASPNLTPFGDSEFSFI
ncbi:reverse transcriptase domain-containing protein [Tanacetum coccineum]